MSRIWNQVLRILPNSRRINSSTTTTTTTTTTMTNNVFSGYQSRMSITTSFAHRHPLSYSPNRYFASCLKKNSAIFTFPHIQSTQTHKKYNPFYLKNERMYDSSAATEMMEEDDQEQDMTVHTNHTNTNINLNTLAGMSTSSFMPTSSALLTAAATTATSNSKWYFPLNEKKHNLDNEPLIPLIVCGPSGVGKGTLINYIVQTFPQHFQMSISHTTRAPRSHEKHGRHYYFIDHDKFERRIQEDEFIEYSQVHGKYYYGTSKYQLEAIANKGKIVIIEVDIEGAKTLKHKLITNLKCSSDSIDHFHSYAFPHKHHSHYNRHSHHSPPSHHNKTRHSTNNNNKEARYLFITTSGGHTSLAERLKTRGTETAEQIARRLNTANSEFDFLRKSPEFFDFVLFNDDLEKSKQNLVDVLKKWYLCLN